MSNFSNEIPTGFLDEPYHLMPTDIVKHSLSLTQIENQGLRVVSGLRRQDVPALTEIARQPSTVEYCPNDIVKRWTDEETVERQLAKDGGRAVFRLESKEDGKTLGFGWTGRASQEETAITGCGNTFAIRLHEAARGKGLATPFSVVIVAGSMAVYGMRGIGLETWSSNRKAVNAYLGAGAVLMGSVDSQRPTLNLKQRGLFFDAFNGEQTPHRLDSRLYMQYPWSNR
jgi:hypothetical protein